MVSQFEQELRGALNSLVAAVEVEPEEVKWQPLEHAIALGAAQDPDQLCWVVIERARRIAARDEPTVDSEEIAAIDDWRYLHQRLAAPAPDRAEREPDAFDELLLMVARSAAPLNADLQRLLLLAGALPLGAWLVAAAAGHWFCRRALQPVLDMSAQARSMAGADFQSRLPVATTRDELADLATAFNTLLDRQHRAFEQQRRFTGDAAHELRTPLTVLLGQIEVALRRPRSPEQYAETLRVLREQTVQLRTIVESLLFLARADDDATLPDAELIALAAWLPGYMGRWRQHARRADITLRAAENGDCRIIASPALLTRLLDNLVENALKYSSAGSRVEVAVSSDGDGVAVTVADQGRGIADDDLPAIFEPFFRSRAARDAGIAGTGLGLAIAMRIATALRGRLTCASQLHQGARFTLWLPKA